ncbi:MAG: hypothetical protein A2284_06015 [Deltaproteobacteria bacterium RIFOXYA12_FULL_61_11]|nr:MAG: hypothetical protein A2284_06015 [Deltaproteobacteria bacterium RIFOXYA12_FULL_61_11]
MQGFIPGVSTLGWLVYLLRCADDTLYCGATNNLPKRLEEHQRGRGARYTRGRGPVALVGSLHCPRGRSEALSLEAAIKRLRRPAKLQRFGRVPETGAPCGEGKESE